MKPIVFKAGVLKVNWNLDKEMIAFMCFHPANLEYEKYVAVEKSLPRIKGLKSKRKRVAATIELIQELKINGYEIR